jgi:hypothetical protein
MLTLRKKGETVFTYYERLARSLQIYRLVIEYSSVFWVLQSFNCVESELPGFVELELFFIATVRTFNYICSSA